MTPNRDTVQVIFAVILSILILGGLAVIGLWGLPLKSEAITPLLPVADHPATLNSPASGQALGLPTDNANRSEHIPDGGTPSFNRTASATGTPTIRGNASPPTASLVRASLKTPTPVRVAVSTQQRSWVFYHGPAIYVRADAFAPLLLSSFPRPANDDGRGLHWFPTTYQTRAVVDRFIPELAAMRIRWLVILQGMSDWDLVANDYLVAQLVAAGIMPIMRIDRQVGPMDWQRLGWIVARYRERGVRYFQIYNEPNVDEEWGTDASHSPERFVGYWIQAAEVVAANGGLPGFAPMSPQKDDSDLVFFRAALEELKRLGRFDLANLMWVSVHNYGDLHTHPTDDGFFRYRDYAARVKQVFGGTLPVIITEGGLADADAMANVIVPMYQFVASESEPYLLAFAPWLIGNAVGGGHDPRWESAAWFTGTLTQVQPRFVVEQAKQ